MGQSWNGDGVGFYIFNGYGAGTEFNYFHGAVAGMNFDLRAGLYYIALPDKQVGVEQTVTFAQAYVVA